MRVSNQILLACAAAAAASLAIFLLSRWEIGKVERDAEAILEEWTEMEALVAALTNLERASAEPAERGHLHSGANELRSLAAGDAGLAEDHESREAEVFRKMAGILDRAAVATGTDLPGLCNEAHALLPVLWLEDSARVAQRAVQIARRQADMRRLHFAWGAGLVLLPLVILLRLRRTVLRPLAALQARVEGIGGLARTGKGMDGLQAAVEAMATAVEERRARLEAEVRSRTDQLRHAERLGGLGRIAAAVAHELNNPLGSIGLCVDGIRESLGHGEGERAVIERKLATMRKEIDRCTVTTRKLLTYAHYRPAARERVEPGRLVEEAFDLVSGHARRAQVRLGAACSREGAVLEGDANQLRQVIVNLLLNAIDASPAGGEVHVESFVAGGRVRTHVKDRGAGVPLAARDRIFTPFFTTKRPGVGTGLGLAISREIVEAHGGGLALGSPHPGWGAVFEIDLPACQVP